MSTLPRVTGAPRFLDTRSAHTADEERYLLRLDALLPAALGDRVDPEDVGCVWYGGVMTWLEVPEVPSGEAPVINNQLQIQYNAQALGAYWGCSHLWDDYDHENPEHLALPTSDLSPEDAAERAAEWIHQQLQRPIVRQEWDRIANSPAFRWVLADNDTVLGSRGWVLRRKKRPPDRVIALTGC